VSRNNSRDWSLRAAGKDTEAAAVLADLAKRGVAVPVAEKLVRQ
jgi:hypothetical protein